MAVVTDLLDETSVVEEGGYLLTATRKFLVTQVLGSTLWEQWNDAMTNFSALGVPQCGDVLHPIFWPYMICVRRIPQYVAQDASGYGQVIIICEYERIQAEELSPMLVSGGANLSQMKTNVDRDGKPLEFIYGTTGDPPVPDKYPTEVDVFDIHGTFSIETIEYTVLPEKLVGQWVNYVNSDTWRGGAPKTWMCTDVQWDLIHGPTGMYRFRWTFEWKSSTWVYKMQLDQDKNGNLITNPGPSDVVTLSVDWHKERDFNEKFNWKA